jgi:hypothetical protein
VSVRASSGKILADREHSSAVPLRRKFAFLSSMAGNYRR